MQNLIPALLAFAVLAMASFGAAAPAEAKCVLDDRTAFVGYPCWARQAFTAGIPGGPGE